MREWWLLPPSLFLAIKGEHMEFEIKGSVLGAALQRIKVALADKTPLSAYKGARFDIEGSQMLLSTFSPTIDTEVLFTVAAKGSGTFGVNLKLLVNVVEAFPSGDIRFTVAGPSVLVKSGRSSCKMNLHSDVENFPRRGLAAKTYEPLDMHRFLEAVNKVSFCVDREADNYKSTVAINKDHMVATDGMRLSIIPNHAFAAAGPILLKAATAEKILKIYNDLPADSGVALEEGCLHIGCAGIYTATRLVALPYPKYQSVLPSGACAKCQVGRKGLNESLRRALLMEGEQVQFSFGGSSVSLSSIGSDGVAEDTIDASGDAKGEVLLNAAFVQKALSKMTSERVTFEYRGGEAPVVLTDGDHVNVFLPFRRGV